MLVEKIKELEFNGASGDMMGTRGENGEGGMDKLEGFKGAGWTLSDLVFRVEAGLVTGLEGDPGCAIR